MFIGLAGVTIRYMILFTPSRRMVHRLVRAVLLMYVLTLGVAMASPMIRSDAMSLICTSTGYKLIGQTSGDSTPGKIQPGQHLLDCPLCTATGIPPAFSCEPVCEPPHTLSYATRSIPAARLASIVSAPLPARGPPLISQ